MRDPESEPPSYAAPESLMVRNGDNRNVCYFQLLSFTGICATAMDN